jgi:Mg-chelatase subunit ChlD
MLAVELGVFTQDPDTIKLVTSTAKQIILKMNRGEAGVLSSRLAEVTGERGLRRAQQWQSWLMKTGRRFNVQATHAVDKSDQPVALSGLAMLDSESFCNMEDYIAKLGQKEVDLAIVLDCTASMSGEIGAAQGGIDDMMLFVGDMVSSLRVGVVAYRDRRDEFETKVFEFTSDIAAARQQIWTLVADGGGDSPESVFPALKSALSELAWRPASSKVLVIVGDAPPHVGSGTQCVNAVERARDQFQLTTHVIQAEGKDVKFFPEIAKAGGGRCVSLDDDDTLMGEIAGLALGDRFQNEFREFFRVYLELCR